MLHCVKLQADVFIHLLLSSLLTFKRFCIYLLTTGLVFKLVIFTQESSTETTFEETATLLGKKPIVMD